MAHMFVNCGALVTVYRGQDETVEYWKERAKFYMTHIGHEKVEQLSYVHANMLFYNTEYSEDVMSLLCDCKQNYGSTDE
jgi:hypothetical protein